MSHTEFKAGDKVVIDSIVVMIPSKQKWHPVLDEELLGKEAILENTDNKAFPLALVRPGLRVLITNTGDFFDGFPSKIISLAKETAPAKVEEKITFQIGDRVSWMGLLGRIISTEVPGYINALYCINVDFGVHGTESFTKDGKIHEYHKEPSLIFVSRPKKIVKTLVDNNAVLDFNGGSSPIVILSNGHKLDPKISQVRNVKITIEYELSEE